jgi:hypothetical protein
MTISSSVKELLKTRINTFEKLDLVVTLHQSPHETMSVEALIRALGAPRDVIRQAVGDLRRALLVDFDSRGEVRLLAATDADRTAIGELVESYRDDPAIVLRFLGEVALDRIRSMAATTFADAFVLRRKKGEDDG